ncbi:MAG TPA: TonB-dependent receptor, partial [Opitutaceae bacterium]
LDGTYNLNGNFFHTLMAGVRYAERFASNKPGLIFADFNYPVAERPSATLFPELISTNTAGFFPYTGTPSIRNYMTGVLDGTRDAAAYRSQFGITTPLPESASPLTLWDIDETTTAAYLLARFKAGRLPLEGNIGIRAVRTEEAVSGSRTIPATSTTPQTTGPIDIDTSYDDYLPSLNTRYSLRDDLFLKFSASKTLTRPDFGQMSPSLTLVPNPIDPALNQGSAGNPELSPIKADNYDLALEKYFSPANYVYATLFYKDVDGFIISSAATEVYDGVPYLITRPRNANAAKIKGFELGYTQFLDFLPEPFRNFGVQANYTYVDSETPNATLGIDTPLPNLSKHSYNVIAMYETKKLSARVAYNWRDKFLSGQANIANVGRIPFYTKDYGWLDASISYAFSDHFTLSIEGTNLTRTKRISYYGVETRPQNVYINDRQVSASITMKF